MAMMALPPVEGWLFSQASAEMTMHGIAASGKVFVASVDRGGDTFWLVLNYLRYSSLKFPVAVSMEMYLLNLDFYGIVYMARVQWTQVKKRHDAMKSVEKENMFT